MPNPLRLSILIQLREQMRPRLTHAHMAQACGLRGRQSRLTVGKWERGETTPELRWRPGVMRYLWDHLHLRHDLPQFETVWAILVEEWLWEPLNEREWHDLTHTQRSRPVRPAPTVAAPVVHRAPVAPFQAPPPVPHFVGRQLELQQLWRLGHSRPLANVVALVGGAGIGKSSLAIQAAHVWHAEFPDGVLWADATRSDPLNILQSWALAYECDYRALNDGESRAAAVRNLLRHKRVLILIDDARELARVQPLLPASPASLVLLTTRNPDLAAQINAQVLPLAPLPAPDGLDLLSAIVGAERVQAELAVALAICQRVQQVPLAVEKSARLLARTPGQPLAHLAQHLGAGPRRGDPLLWPTAGDEWQRSGQQHGYLLKRAGFFEEPPKIC